MTNLLIVDGERCMRNTLKERLEYEGYRIDTAENGDEALSKIGQKTYQLVLADLLIASPGVTDLLETLSHSAPNPTPLIVLSSLKGIEPAIDCIRHGAFDYLAKPVNLNKLLESIRAALEDKNQNRATMERSACGTKKLATLSSVVATPRRPNPLRDHLIGTSAAMIHVQRLVEKVATSDARVLIIGENGTGKELVARQLHAKSLRCEEAFVEVNCAAIPSELIESELFGHEKGSFTSANKQHKGKFEQADGGTLTVLVCVAHWNHPRGHPVSPRTSLEGLSTLLWRPQAAVAP
ncbi:MAG: sigma 54-interacting transcriptional regulator, partial [Alistipes sp.]|nr:sigma 54-interacting transcriptional regulator [Alistipes sp.]